MELSITELLKNRIEATDLKEHFEYESKEYNKKWAAAVQYFQIRINKDRVREKFSPYSFIVIRQKLEHIKEIDDLRWFYKECLKYSYKRDKFGRKVGSFSRCFFGALKTK